MEELSAHTCTICGEAGTSTRRWFLIAEDRWEDKLKILHWDARLAARPGIHPACSSTHVQELVVHWMATGSLDHPFARSDFGAGTRRPRPWPLRNSLNATGAKPISELAVHRESVKRVLKEDPQSLKAILDALMSALEDEDNEVAWQKTA